MRTTLSLLLAASLIAVGATWAAEESQIGEPKVDVTLGGEDEGQRETKEVLPDTKKLFNGEDFDGWTFHLADEDADPMDTWSVKDGVVHCKGQPAGYMRTTEKYSDYRLSFHWRWAGEEGGNSGCLLHIQKPDKVWPKSIESQLMAGNAGDIFVIGGTTFKEHTDKDSRRVPKMAESNEKPAGEWNQMTVACQGDAITIQVNGQLQNKATEATVTEGFIGLQSEGVPIEFKNITLTPLE